jgi:fluoroacetyl-CoA thioesterase
MSLQLGRRGVATLVVTGPDTALSQHTGSVDVLSTPRVIALCEEAAVLAIGDELPVGQTTVGMRVQLDHLQPTSVGSEVVAHATLDRMEGRRLTFTVQVKDRCGLVAVGKVTRAVVDTAAFLAVPVSSFLAGPDSRAQRRATSPARGQYRARQ